MVQATPRSWQRHDRPPVEKRGKSDRRAPPSFFECVDVVGVVRALASTTQSSHLSLSSENSSLNCDYKGRTSNALATSIMLAYTTRRHGAPSSDTIALATHIAWWSACTELVSRAHTSSAGRSPDAFFHPPDGGSRGVRPTSASSRARRTGRSASGGAEVRDPHRRRHHPLALGVAL